MLTATIFDIERNSYADGPGIRTTVFFKGCDLACAWCHNPESQDPAPQMMFYRDLCRGCGKCAKVCPHGLEKCDLCGRCALFCPTDARRICGKEIGAEELLAEILKDKDFYENSGGGATFSGGECMLQIDFLCEMLRLCRENGVHTAVDTAGSVPFERFERILPWTDLFLYDVKCFGAEKHKACTGADNARILDNLRRLFSLGAKIRIRIPVIAGVNDSLEEMQAIRAFLDSCGRPEKVELLPYHAFGENKYAALGRPVPSFSPPDAARLAELRRVFE